MVDLNRHVDTSIEYDVTMPPVKDVNPYLVHVASAMQAKYRMNKRRRTERRLKEDKMKKQKRCTHTHGSTPSTGAGTGLPIPGTCVQTVGL
jgi:hypothetical protein